MKTKAELLEAKEYKPIKGYLLPYDKQGLDECTSIIIERSEVEEFYKSEPKTYYFHEYVDSLMNEAEAWEHFEERYCDDKDLDISSEDFEKLMGVK